MAGVSVEQGGAKRRSLDSEINMIPMIDLLMVTISFLLITAVWVHSQRLTADAAVPGSAVTPPCAGDECKQEPRLHVETADPTKFVLVWKQGRTVVRSVDVPRAKVDNGDAPSYPALASEIAAEWRAAGAHRAPNDTRFDHAVVHASNDMSYAELVAVMDAVASPKRLCSAASPAKGKPAETSAFEVILAVD